MNRIKYALSRSPRRCGTGPQECKLYVRRNAQGEPEGRLVLRRRSGREVVVGRPDRTLAPNPQGYGLFPELTFEDGSCFDDSSSKSNRRFVPRIFLNREDGARRHTTPSASGPTATNRTHGCIEDAS